MRRRANAADHSGSLSNEHLQARPRAEVVSLRLEVESGRTT